MRSSGKSSRSVARSRVPVSSWTRRLGIPKDSPLLSLSTFRMQRGLLETCKVLTSAAGTFGLTCPVMQRVAAVTGVAVVEVEAITRVTIMATAEEATTMAEVAIMAGETTVIMIGRDLALAAAAVEAGVDGGVEAEAFPVVDGLTHHEEEAERDHEAGLGHHAGLQVPGGGGLPGGNPRTTDQSAALSAPNSAAGTRHRVVLVALHPGTVAHRLLNHHRQRQTPRSSWYLRVAASPRVAAPRRLLP
mmetsp:Transcript_32501/g.59741  ORF Transcript_32501/g.59741 Transcript_32501/m.59741 type:complete len:246 (-) Transcript_32501:347-1084(-)